MSYAPYTNLQATNDFTTFQFSSPTLSDPTIRQLRFIGQPGGRIYQVEIRNRPADKRDDPSWPDSKDFYRVVLTALLIIEIYSERYHRRVLRFSGDTPLNALVFGTILARYHHLLKQLFLIETETPVTAGAAEKDRFGGFPGTPGSNERSYGFAIKRKPIPFFSVHTIESSWNGTSRMFNNDFTIEMDKTIRIGLTLPTV